MELNANKEASMNINRKFNELCESPTHRSIYKVHNQYLQNSSDNVYEPAVVAIGPYHRGKQRLKMVEEQKVRYLNSLLLRKNENIDRYISAAAEIEQEARNCYAEAIILTTAEFIEMLVLDACFIIELLRKSNGRDSGDHDHDHDRDPIFQMAWILNNLRRDLILFENQIPFFVLCKMFDLIIDEPNQHQKLIEMFSVFYGIEKLHHSNWKNDRSPKEVKHLLHLMHATSRPSSHSYVNLNACPLRREFRRIPSATDLKDANVRFQKSEPDAAFEVGFKKGTLTMPALTIQDGTESFFRNLIVYEQYFPGNQPTYVTDYVVILDCLVNTLGDVEVLSGCGIIDNMVGDNQMAAEVVNRLAHSVLLSETYFIYADTFGLINAHCKKRWNRAMAALRRDYFNSPWAYISFFAAVLLMLLTLAQTVFSALQKAAADIVEEEEGGGGGKQRRRQAALWKKKKKAAYIVEEEEGDDRYCGRRRRRRRQAALWKKKNKATPDPYLISPQKNVDHVPNFRACKSMITASNRTAQRTGGGDANFLFFFAALGWIAPLIGDA